MSIQTAKLLGVPLPFAVQVEAPWRIKYLKHCRRLGLEPDPSPSWSMMAMVLALPVEEVKLAKVEGGVKKKKRVKGHPLWWLKRRENLASLLIFLKKLNLDSPSHTANFVNTFSDEKLIRRGTVAQRQLYELAIALKDFRPESVEDQKIWGVLKFFVSIYLTALKGER